MNEPVIKRSGAESSRTNRTAAKDAARLSLGPFLGIVLAHALTGLIISFDEGTKFVERFHPIEVFGAAFVGSVISFPIFYCLLIRHQKSE